MLGLNIPTWGVLDLLSVEGEYWKNPYLNSDFKVANSTTGPVAAPYLDGNTNLGLSARDAVDGDDFRWSVTATKSLWKSLSVTAKASSDHMQIMQLFTNRFDRSYGDVMLQKDSWYYVLRVQVAI